MELMYLYQISSLILKVSLGTREKTGAAMMPLNAEKTVAKTSPLSTKKCICKFTLETLSINC